MTNTVIQRVEAIALAQGSSSGLLFGNAQGDTTIQDIEPEEYNSEHEGDSDDEYHEDSDDEEEDINLTGAALDEGDEEVIQAGNHVGNQNPGVADIQEDPEQENPEDPEEDIPEEAAYQQNQGVNAQNPGVIEEVDLISEDDVDEETNEEEKEVWSDAVEEQPEEPDAEANEEPVEDPADPIEDPDP